MDYKEIFKPTHFNRLLIIILACLILVFVFSLGVLVGHERARFSVRFGENYYNNIMGPGGPGMMNFGRPQFNARGAFSQIIKIEGNNIVVKGQNNAEKIITVNEKTVIREFDQDLKIGDLKVDENIVVIGVPNEQGQIEAKLIRVMPEPPSNGMMNLR